MQIRLLLRADAAACKELRLRALREHPAAFSSSYEEECEIPLEQVAERLEPPPAGVVLGAFEDGKLVGMAGLARERPRKLSHKAVIWGVYVAPPFRRRHVGRRLLEAALEHAACLPGLRQVNLGANAASRASIALYRSVGFEPFGVEKGFLLVDGVLHDEIHMARAVAAREPAIPGIGERE